MGANRHAADTDAMYQYTDQAALWQQKVQELMAEGGGIKAASKWRDGPACYASGR